MKLRLEFTLRPVAPPLSTRDVIGFACFKGRTGSSEEDRPALGKRVSGREEYQEEADAISQWR